MLELKADGKDVTSKDSDQSTFVPSCHVFLIIFLQTVDIACNDLL